MSQVAIIGRKRIEAAAAGLDLVVLMEGAFLSYSEGRARVSAVGELLFAEPRGEAHIKAASADGAARFVVKVATGFYDNPRRGLPSSSGLMLLFDAATGEPAAILLDEGHLTDLRTAAAGATAAKWLAPDEVAAIAVLGAGVQARLQLAALRGVTACRDVWLWARRRESAEALAAAARALGFRPYIAATPAEAADDARLIITTTPAAGPLLAAADVRPGSLVIAVGSDTPEKGELADDLIAAANRLVADSRLQASQRGELRRAPAAAAVVELGEVIAAGARAPTSPDGVTICDLTGVATQDLAIALAVAGAAAKETA